MTHFIVARQNNSHKSSNCGIRGVGHGFGPQGASCNLFGSSGECYATSSKLGSIAPSISFPKYHALTRPVPKEGRETRVEHPPHWQPSHGANVGILCHTSKSPCSKLFGEVTRISTCALGLSRLLCVAKPYYASACFVNEDPLSFRFMSSRALVSASGLSVTSLLLHLSRLFESPDPVFDPCPVCPASTFPLDFSPQALHLPSLAFGVCLGVVLLPLVELVVCIRGYLWVRLDRQLRPAFRYRLL